MNEFKSTEKKAYGLITTAVIPTYVTGTHYMYLQWSQRLTSGQARL